MFHRKGYWARRPLGSSRPPNCTNAITLNDCTPLETTTIAFGLAMVGTFGLWYLKERSLSIHSIFTAKRELFYWAAILFIPAARDLFATAVAPRTPGRRCGNSP